MDSTATHDCSIADSDFISYKAQWESYLKNEISVWRDFHNFWMKQDLPVHIIRYEDLVARPGEIMPDFMRFVFGTKDIEGTLLESYINIAVAEGAKKTYKPRVGKANANMDKYSQELLDNVAKCCPEQLKCLGYYHLLRQPDSDKFIVDGRCDWITKYNKKQLEFSLKKQKGPQQPFVMINNRNMEIRAPEFNPLEFPNGRGFQRFARYMMPRATKIGKTLIQQSIKSGDHITVGKKGPKSVKVNI